MTTQVISPRHIVRKTSHDDIDLMKYFYMFLGNWYWFALAVIVATGTAYFINKNTPKVYRVTASMLVEDPTRSSMGSMFGGSDIMGYGYYNSWYNLQNQILIMKSLSMLSKTIHSLDFNVSYFSDELLGPREKLNEVPFVVIPDYSKLQPLGVRFVLEINSDGSMKLGSEMTAKRVTLHNFLTEKSKHGPEELIVNSPVQLGEIIEGEGYAFSIIPRDDGENTVFKPGKWYFSFTSYKDLINKWGSLLNIKSVDENASMVSLEIDAVCPEKARIFLNKHLEMYLQRTLDKKNQVATNTINFIDRQLISIADSLYITEISLRDFRKNNEVVDLSFQSRQIFEQTRELDNQMATLKIQDDYFKYLLDYLTKNRISGDLIAPSVSGVNDPLLNNLVLELNRMTDQKIVMTGSGGSRNPYLGTLESQIRNTKARLEETTRNFLNKNKLAMAEINNRLNSLMTEIRKLPQTERELLGIERRFKLNDNIYTYLMQRRAEAQITKASNTPDNEIIDQATVRDLIRPKTTRNYAIAALLGIGLPGLILVLLSVFNNKVISEEDIKSNTDIPVAGYIIHSNRDYQTVVLNDPKSQVAENFRNLRNRLQFLTRETPSPVILITSSMPSEGKTFASINLASVYSLAGKRTLLVGFDLRKPKIYDDFDIPSDKGVSTYLIGQNKIGEIIYESGYQNLFIIPAGPVSPNPAELVGLTKTKELFIELKKWFDYIIIDSAPLGIVSDTYSLASVSDIIIILVRHNKTIRHVLENTIADAKANGITGISLLMNDISRSSGIYGYSARYRYGYGYRYGYSNDYGYYSDNGKSKM